MTDYEAVGNSAHVRLVPTLERGNEITPIKGYSKFIIEKYLVGARSTVPLLFEYRIKTDE